MTPRMALGRALLVLFKPFEFLRHAKPIGPHCTNVGVVLLPLIAGLELLVTDGANDLFKRFPFQRHLCILRYE
jgi:hypothetical protein